MNATDLFRTTTTPDPHRARRRAVLRTHPEARQLIGRDPVSLLFIAVFVGTQLAIAYGLRHASCLTVFATAFAIGAFLAAGLNSLIHDASHNLVASSRAGNRLAAILANLPSVSIQAMPFFYYHPWHHRATGDYAMDVGIPTYFEARWVGCSTVRKAIWLALFPLFQIGRTRKFHQQASHGIWDRWMMLNAVVQLLADALILWAWGPLSLLYLGSSMWLSVGPHPVGTRVIQEHFFTEEGQETHSYVGPCNIAELNFGYHVEHHDLPGVPWRRLPALRRLAPELYETVHTYRSRLSLLAAFLFAPAWHLGRHTVGVGRVRPRPITLHRGVGAPEDGDAGEDMVPDALSMAGK